MPKSVKLKERWVVIDEKTSDVLSLLCYNDAFITNHG